MNRRVSGPRKAYVKTFLEWMDKNGAKIDGVEVADFGEQGKIFLHGPNWVTFELGDISQ